MNLFVFVLRSLRKLWERLNVILSPKVKEDYYQAQLFEDYVQYFDQDANGIICEILKDSKPRMIAKFGTVELGAMTNYISINQEHYSVSNLGDFITGKRNFLWWNTSMPSLCNNAGFFPNNEKLYNKFCQLYIDDIKEIDILGSYLEDEKYFESELKNAIRVNLDGYYAPFYYDQPWTRVLKGKRVLVIHPFEESIRSQYARKEQIWENPDILPEFELITIKAVQTIAGQETQFNDWFEALGSMQEKIENIDFDIALIGCGAYGLPLCAYVKRMGRQSVHLAGWLQILFGIKGKRWTENPSVAKYMNKSWVHPLSSEVPSNHERVEGGCYW